MKKFAQLLGTYVEASGMKQTYLASTANISYNYLQRLLAGDRNPSDQVVYRLAQALHLSTEQTGSLLAAAGHALPLALLEPPSRGEPNQDVRIPSRAEPDQAMRLAQQLYRLDLEIPEAKQAAFLEEMKHLLGYARYKYVFSGGTNFLELDPNLSDLKPKEDLQSSTQAGYPYLNLIAQLVGELHQESGNGDSREGGELSQSPQVVEDMLSAIDHLTGSILTGEMSATIYQPELIVQTLDMLREGAPWEIRRRIAEALPGLCQLDVNGAEHLMETLRMDTDEIRGVDIRRRVIEAIPAFVEASPLSLEVAVHLLRPRLDDDKYVALASVEVCADIQAKIKQLTEQPESVSKSGESPAPETFPELLPQSLIELSRMQRQLLTTWEGIEREALQFSLALHNLLCAPDTLLLSLREGLQSSEKLVQLVAVRYIERLLPLRPLEALELYRMVLGKSTYRNVRRTVAKALPGLLHCLQEASLAVRAVARSVIIDLATDPDIYIRRAVADHATQVFHIDREFLLILLRHMHKDSDQAIRHRLQPVALRLAQVWLIWYAETAGLVDTKRDRGNTLAPFGE